MPQLNVHRALQSADAKLNDLQISVELEVNGLHLYYTWEANSYKKVTLVWSFNGKSRHHPSPAGVFEGVVDFARPRTHKQVALMCERSRQLLQQKLLMVRKLYEVWHYVSVVQN